MSKLVAMLVVVVALVATVSVASAFQPLHYTNEYGKPVQIFQISPNCGYSDGDQNSIVMELSESFGGDGKCYGYAFFSSTVIVTITGDGARAEGEANIIDVNSIAVSYNKDTTEILSVAWSDKKEAYLLTFKEDGRVHAEWLDFRSPVFKEVAWQECSDTNWAVKTDRREMGLAITVINNKTTGIEFRPENRK